MDANVYDRGKSLGCVLKIVEKYLENDTKFAEKHFLLLHVKISCAIPV